MISKHFNQRGFTLLELLISLSILAFVIGSVYTFYDYGSKAFQEGEQHWLAQRQVRDTADYLSNELRYAYSLKLLDPKEKIPEKPTKEDHYIYLDVGKNYIHRYADAAGKPQERIIINANDYSLAFYRVEQNKDIGNEPIPNVLGFSVVAGSVNYQIESAITLLNMPTDSISETIPDSETSNIYYTKITLGEIIEEPPDPPRGCFIATAAYDSEFAPAVMLLRQFRDNYLLTNGLGEEFVQFYYRHSPSVAAYIAANEPLKWGVRIILLPVVGLAFIIMQPALWLALIMTLLAGYASKKQKKLFLWE